MLKYSQCVGKTKRLDIVFKVSIPCLKCGLSLVAFLDANQIIGSLKVNPCINLPLANLIKKSKNKWQGISIFDDDLIQTTIVHKHTK